MTSERARAGATATPPVAEKRPRKFSVHGVALTDDYAWLKDENWQQVLRDPSVLAADIRRHLEAENTYSEAVLAGTQSLQKQLVAEMRARIKEDDSTVPSPDGPFEYLTRYREGGQHELIGRQARAGSEVHIILDGDALAATSKYFNFGGAEHSPDHKLQAWSADLRGSEYFSIRVRSWTDGQDAADLIEQTDGSMVWTADSACVLLCPARRESPSAASLSPPARHVTSRRRADLSGAGHRLVHTHPSERQRPPLRHCGRRSRNLRVPADRPRRFQRPTSPGRSSRDWHSLFGRRSRRRSVHPDQRRLCHRLQDCRCTPALRPVAPIGATSCPIETASTSSI